MKPVSIHPTPLSIVSVENTVPAGFPIPHTDATNTSIDLNAQLLINPESSFLFRVVGDSMSGIGIFENDRIIVDRAIEARHGHIVLAVVDGEFTVKRLFSKDKIIRLIPENDAYKPIDFRDGQELEIWGVVTTNLRRLI